MNETLKSRVIQSPPGTAAGAGLTDCQFGGSRHGYAAPSRVQHLAREEFTPCETAVLETVLQGLGDMAQPQLYTLVAARLQASRSRVAKAAQHLAQQGKIGRQKIRGCWHYGPPGSIGRVFPDERKECSLLGLGKNSIYRDLKLILKLISLNSKVPWFCWGVQG